jgi:hypothetical protein
MRYTLAKKQTIYPTHKLINFQIRPQNYCFFLNCANIKPFFAEMPNAKDKMDDGQWAMGNWRLVIV